MGWWSRIVKLGHFALLALLWAACSPTDTDRDVVDGTWQWGGASRTEGSGLLIFNPQSAPDLTFHNGTLTISRQGTTIATSKYVITGDRITYSPAFDVPPFGPTEQHTVRKENSIDGVMLFLADPCCNGWEHRLSSTR
jgi:hypothetical protein